MSALDDYWAEHHEGNAPKAPSAKAPAAPAPAPVSDLDAYWAEKHEGQAPSTAIERQAQQAKAKGEPLGNVNISYLGEYGRPKAAGHLSPAQQYQHLLSLGASPNEAHLLTAAAASESELNPLAHHDQNTGYGLYGHRLDRLDAMRKFAGEEFPSWQKQNAFALQELRSRPEYSLVQGAKNARDLAIAQMHFERPKGYSEQNPTAGHNFAGRLTTLNQFAGLRGEDRIPRGELTPEWGVGHSLATGATLGFAPQIQAAYEAGYNPFVGGKYAMNQERYQQRLAELQEQRRLYNLENPLAGYGAEGLGSVATTAIPIARAGQVLGQAAERVAPMVAPAVAPFVPQALRFLGGEAGQAIPQVAGQMPGIAGTATRLASAGAQGALQGVTQTGLEAGSRALGGSLGDTETPLSEQFGTSALLGGTLGPALSKLVSPKAGGALAPEWEAGPRQVGQRALEEFNIPVHPGQFAKGEAQEFFRETAPQSLLNEQNKRFSEEVAKIIGAKDLTPVEVEKAAKDVGDQMSIVAGGVRPLRQTPAAARQLYDIYTDSLTLRDDNIRKIVQGIIHDVGNDLATGQLNGKVFQKYTQKGGIIDRQLSAASNSIKKYYGGELRNMMFDLLAANDPTAAAKWSKLRSVYRDIINVDPHTTTSGIVDPRAIANAVGKKGSTSRLKDLAPVGEFLQGTEPSGAASAISRRGGDFSPAEIWRTIKQNWRPLTFGGSAASVFAPGISDIAAAGGPLFQYALPTALAGAATTFAARDFATKQALKSPAVRKQVFAETFGKEKRRAARNVIRGAVSLNPLAGEE